MRPMVARGLAKMLGLNMIEDMQITNSRFAEDMLLISSSADDLQVMLTDLAERAGNVGLKMHYGKTGAMQQGCQRSLQAHTVDNARQVSTSNAKRRNYPNTWEER